MIFHEVINKNKLAPFLWLTVYIMLYSDYHHYVTIAFYLTATTDLINFINCHLQNLAENWSRARDVNGRDLDETETLTVFIETRPRQDTDMSRD